MKQVCENARTLIPSYLDGEVTEEQASPLRSHLLECPSCRELAKSDTALKRWFQGAAEARADEAVVPIGFAARVARRAFAGDPGLLEPMEASGSRSNVGDGDGGGGRLLSFVLAATAVAAVVVIVLSAAIRFQEALPAGNDMDATESRELSETLRELDRENRELEEAARGGRSEED